MTENVQVRAFGTVALNALFQSSVDGIHRPLTTLMYGVEHYWTGLNPFAYHLNNLLLHLVTVALVFLLLMQLKLTFTAALGAALIFAIHPSRVESVAWIAQRQELLFSVFYVGALLAYLRGRLLLTGGLALASVLASPQAWSFPFILILIDWYRGCRIDVNAVIARWPFFLISGGVALFTLIHKFGLPFLDFPQQCLLFIWTVIFYLRHFFIPVLSLPIHQVPEPIALLNPAYLFAVIVFILLVVGAWFLRRQRLVIFAMLFYGVLIFSSWVVVPNQGINTAAEHLMYLPALGLAVLMAFTLEAIYLFLKGQEAVVRFLFVIALGALTLGLGLVTVQQASVWKNDFLLWQHQVKFSPNAMAYNNLAQAYQRQPSRDNAKVIDLYQRAINVDGARHAIYSINLAEFYKEIGLLDKSLEGYQAVLAVDPKHREAYFGLAEVYQLKGQADKVVGAYNQLIKFYPDDEDVYIKAIEAYGRAIDESPQNVLYQEKREELLSAFEQLSTRKKYTAVDFYNLGFLYQQVGGREEAIRYYVKALQLQSNYAQALYNLATLYQEAGDLKTALVLYQRLVHMHSSYVLGYLNMGVIYNTLGDQDRARQLYLKVLQIDPKNSRAYFHLGYLNESQGNMKEAISNYEDAIDGDAANAEAYYNLGNVYAQLGQSPEAIAMYIKTVGVNPKHENAYVNLSILSFKLRDFQGAIRYLEQAQELGYNAPAEYLKTLELYRKK